MSRVVTAACEWKRAAERVQSEPLPGLPAGAPGVDQAPREVSKPSASVVVPVTSRTSSTNAPVSPVPGSETYERETSTFPPAQALRSTEAWRQPLEGPVKAFQEPVAPVGAQPSSPTVR